MNNTAASSSQSLWQSGRGRQERMSGWTDGSRPPRVWEVCRAGMPEVSTLQTRHRKYELTADRHASSRRETRGRAARAEGPSPHVNVLAWTAPPRSRDRKAGGPGEEKWSEWEWAGRRSPEPGSASDTIRSLTRNRGRGFLIRGRSVTWEALPLVPPPPPYGSHSARLLLLSFTTPPALSISDPA